MKLSNYNQRYGARKALHRCRCPQCVAGGSFQSLRSAVEHIDLAPASGASGCVRLPGSKSISNRTLLLAALAEGQTEIRDLLVSDDTDRMLDALRIGLPPVNALTSSCDILKAVLQFAIIFPASSALNPSKAVAIFAASSANFANSSLAKPA